LEEATRPFLLAQCKAFHSLEDVYKEIESLLKVERIKEFDIHISLPYSFIEPASKKFEADKIQFGAENLLNADEGCFTASIAGKILEEVKAKFVLIGAIQDRFSHAKDSHLLKNKLTTALGTQNKIFVCIGDTLQEYQDQLSKQILIAQLNDCLEGISEEDLKRLYVVYNAEWIARTPWEANSPELQEAYQTFIDAIKETPQLQNFNSNQLIVTIPAYSQDVSQLIQALKTRSHPFLNYSIGILGSSAEYLQHLIKKEEFKSENEVK